MSDFLKRVMERSQVLTPDSLDHFHAFGRAWLEQMISESWPEKWGDNFRVLIYGDFKPPNDKICAKGLRITIYPENRKNTIINGALTVLNADIEVESKSIDAVLDGIKRLNILIGAMTLSSWSNNSVGWWSYLTAGQSGAVTTEFDADEIINISNALLNLNGKAHTRIATALYWMRATPSLVLNHYSNNITKLYSDRWNAFECLVDAI